MKLVLNGVSLLTYLSANGDSTDHAKFIEGTLVVMEDGTVCFGRGYVGATDTSLCRFSFRVHMSGLTVKRQSILGILAHRLECGDHRTIIIRILDNDQQRLFEDICWAWKRGLLSSTMKESDLLRVAEEIWSERKDKSVELEGLKIDLKVLEGDFAKCRADLETCQSERLRLIETSLQQAEDLRKAWRLLTVVETEPEKIPPTRLSEADGVLTTIKRTKKQFLAWDENPGTAITLSCSESLLPGLEPMSEGVDYAWLTRDTTAWYKILSSIADDKDRFSPCVTCVARSWAKNDCNYLFGQKRSCTGCASSGLFCWKVIRYDISKGLVLEKRPGMRIEEKAVARSLLKRLQNFWKVKV